MDNEANLHADVRDCVREVGEHLVLLAIYALALCVDPPEDIVQNNEWLNVSTYPPQTLHSIMGES